MFVESGRVEVEIFIVTLILFAKYVVSVGEDKVTIDQKGSSI